MDSSALAGSIAALRSSIRALEGRSDSLEAWLYLWVALVVVGVALEVGFVLWEYNEDMDEFHRGIIHSPHRPSGRKLLVELLGALLVAIGVAGEFAIDVKGGRVQTDLRTKNGDLVQLLEGVSSAALQRAGELEAQIQPRYLTKQQQQSITAQMRPFAGTGFLIASFWIDAEGERLARQLKSVLSDAGMGHDSTHLTGSAVDMIGQYPEITPGLFGGGGGPPPGSIVRTGVEVWGKNTDAVKTLVKALAAVPAKRLDMPPPGFERFGDAISLAVFVGVKPEANTAAIAAAVEVLKVRAAEAPRRLTPEQRKRLIELLHGAPTAAVAIVSRVVDTESSDFADDFDSALHDGAHWNTRRIRNRISSRYGVSLGTVAGTRFSPEAASLDRALTAIGVVHDNPTFVNGDASTDPPFQSNVLYLVIEQRPLVTSRK